MFASVVPCSSAVHRPFYTGAPRESNGNYLHYTRRVFRNLRQMLSNDDLANRRRTNHTIRRNIMGITRLNANKRNTNTRTIRRLNRCRGKRTYDPTNNKGLLLTTKRLPRQRNVTGISTNSRRLVRGISRFQRNARANRIFGFNGSASVHDPNFFRHVTRNRGVYFTTRGERRRANGATLLYGFRILRIFLHRNEQKRHGTQYDGTFTTLRNTTTRRNTRGNFQRYLYSLRRGLTIIRRGLLPKHDHLCRDYQTECTIYTGTCETTLGRDGELYRHTSTRFQPLRISRRLTSTNYTSRNRPINIHHRQPIKGIRTGTNRTNFRRILRSHQLYTNQTSNAVGVRNSFPQFVFCFWYVLWRRLSKLGETKHKRGGKVRGVQ